MATRQPDSGTNIQATPWTEIALAVCRARLESQAALEDVCRYMLPIIRKYIQHRFHVSQEDAEDLQQAFFEQRVMQGPLLERADRRKGKFRHLVQSDLDHFVKDQLSKAGAKKRNPEKALESDAAASDIAAPDPPSCEPDRAWAMAHAIQACENTRAFYVAKGRPQMWSVFASAELDPTECRPPLNELARQHGFAKGQSVSNAIVTVRRKLVTELRRLIALDVGDDDAAIDETLRESIAILAEAPESSTTLPGTGCKELPPTP